jgi:SAM-dependent methyltransferase
MTTRQTQNELVDYSHETNLHTLTGPSVAMSVLFRDRTPASLLDVGCGRGTWIRAAMDRGLTDVYGVDGVDIPRDQLFFPYERFRKLNLTSVWDLRRKFDVVLCLEVAEHIDPSHSELFIRNLLNHGDTVFFSAACPNQAGQHHVNCQWPVYWQSIFNANGYVCEDSVRWQMWNITGIEAWYRQNMFTARRVQQGAGAEPRILPVLHPDLIDCVNPNGRQQIWRQLVEDGRLPQTWYLTTPIKAFCRKLGRRFPWKRHTE